MVNIANRFFFTLSFLLSSKGPLIALRSRTRCSLAVSPPFVRDDGFARVSMGLNFFLCDFLQRQNPLTSWASPYTNISETHPPFVSAQV
jgi:hypothetical protein